MTTHIDRISRGLATTSSRRQALKMLGGSVVGGALAGAGFAVAKDTAAQGGPPAQGSGLVASGTLDDAVGTVLEGTLSDLVASLSDEGQLLVSGAFTYLDSLGNEVTQLFGGVLADLIPSEEVCDVLFLDLGPIFLDVLGLTIDLSQITLDINAVPGAGNLLGNLLCAVTNLLNNPSGALNGVVNLLNRIFSILG